MAAVPMAQCLVTSCQLNIRVGSTPGAQVLTVASSNVSCMWQTHICHMQVTCVDGSVWPALCVVACSLLVQANGVQAEAAARLHEAQCQ